MKNRLLLYIAAVTILFSCKKSSTGGDVTIAAFPKHHGTSINGATVYIKFKATELPSDPTNNYDMKIVGDPNENHVHITGLRYGKYFLYATGYDTTYKVNVHGGVALKVKWKERKEEIDLDIPVGEE